jgi:flagellar basal body-associated protein FliL
MDKKRILIIVIVAVLALSLIPIIPKAYSTTEQTQRTETYTESEPYTTSTPQSVQLIGVEQFQQDIIITSPKRLI